VTDVQQAPPAAGDQSAPDGSPVDAFEHDFSEGLQELEQFVDLDPNAEQHLAEAIAHEFAAGVTTATWSKLGISLRSLLGEHGRNLFVWPATTGDENDRAQRLAEIESRGSPRLVSLTRTILATYGHELTAAYDIDGQYPNNWRSITREVFYDVLGQRPFLRITISKFNGEEVLIEGPADSILSLTRFFIVSLGMVESGESFNPETVDSFLGDLEPLMKLLRPPAPTAAEEAPDPQSA